ncbi:MAG: molybdopterin-dependent oxidoreductase [Anaerolineae bacterium]|jgi:formate dehydrogenase major subunit|nr:molybdopterin-dependent oxidoreductase [Anaerolineae bacterium]
MSEVHLIINGQEIVAQSGQTVLEAAKAAGIDIPVLCHHPALSNWGACRMCVVEVEGMRNVQTSCTLPVTEGMKVLTHTPKTTSLRKFVLELLFSERNHYCMYCQMSGNCELQDQAYAHGLDHWTYPRPFEKLSVDASRKYFIMDHNRCILCSRCIRACSEIAANHTLNLRNRGAKTMVVADLDVPFGASSCVECGTCLQVCPTGALVDARSAYGGREKDVSHTTTTCMQCSVGCELDVVTRYNRLLRVDGIWGSEPNDGLLCVDGRFKPLYEERKRVTKPLLRQDGALVEVSWNEAFAAVAEKLKSGSCQGLAACATTNEALAAFAKLIAKAGGKAGRLEPAALTLGYGTPARVADVLEADFIIVAGAHPLDYQRVIGYFIHRAADKGVPVAVITDGENALSARAAMTLASAQAGVVAQAAAAAEKVVLVYSVGLRPEVIAALKPLGDKLHFLALDPASNGKGAEAAGLAPLAPTKTDVAYIMLGEQAPEETLQLKAGFKVVQAAYFSPLAEQADVVLPTPIWSERTGHITNLDGVIKPLNVVLPAPAGVRDEAEVLGQLLALLG